MKRFSLLVKSLLPFLATIAVAQPLHNLDQFEWSHRLIIIHAQEAKVDQLQQQLLKNKSEIDNRHIIWFLLSPQDMQSNFSGKVNPNFHSRLLKDWFNPAELPIEVVLIGKDGGEKWRNQTLDLPAIFAEIDSMPMRQYEMMNQ